MPRKVYTDLETILHSVGLEKYFKNSTGKKMLIPWARWNSWTNVFAFNILTNKLSIPWVLPTECTEKTELKILMPDNLKTDLRMFRALQMQLWRLWDLKILVYLEKLIFSSLGKLGAKIFFSFLRLELYLNFACLRICSIVHTENILEDELSRANLNFLG